MLARLEQRLPLLTGGARDAPARQQTLRNTIAWSHDLLSPEEQVLFRRLSVFAGGCTFEAAEAVGNAAGDMSLDIEAGIETLVDASLLQVTDGAEESRFTMLETIREFADEQLVASGEAEQVEQAFEAFLSGTGRGAEQGMQGPDQLVWLERLEAEHDNLRAAMGRALDRGDSSSRAQAGIAALGILVDTTVIGREGRAVARAHFDNRLDQPTRRDRAAAEFGLGKLSLDLGDYEAAEVHYQKSLKARRQLGDAMAEAEVLSALAHD